ncbi:hypothetical protein BHM03_00062491 [Ensete ventricosum]|nr:hypothetical protein BHM03_00062491 [Ensete ventricosum]
MLALPASDDVWWPGGAGAGSCRFLPSLWFLAAPSSPFLLLSCSLITHTAIPRKHGRWCCWYMAKCPSRLCSHLLLEEITLRGCSIYGYFLLL